MSTTTLPSIDSTFAEQATTAIQCSPAAQRNAALDGLRGVAILAVMLYHFTGGYKGTNSFLRMWSLFADAGWMGVDIFFVLSGFLITGILYDTAHKKNRIRNFYARRALRIFPLFYAVLGTLLILTPILKMNWWPEHLLYFCYLSNMTTLLVPSFHLPSQWVNLGHLWSLAVEEQFYFLWPFVVWNVRSRRTLLRIILVVLITGPIVRALLLYGGIAPLDMSRLLIARADSLLFGGGVALLVRGPANCRILARQLFLVSLLLLIVFLVLAHGPDATSGWIAIAGYSLIGLCAASLIFLAHQRVHWVVTFFDSSILRFFGRYSYGLYIFHGIYFVYLRHIAVLLERFTHGGLLAQILMVSFGFGVSIALAMLSYHFFESPILALKHRFTS